MKTQNRIMANILAIQMILSMFLSVMPPVYASENIININSKKDFINFAAYCSLDTQSQGKTVNLNCDIDFFDGSFVPIPIFSGNFNGNGHTLYGIKFKKKGSNMGIFRYICQNGKVSALSVKGDFIPCGSKSFIGSIAGENSGTIENCSFNGNVKGDNVVGGIVGKNSGFIKSCTNNAAVNTVFEEKKKIFRILTPIREPL